MELYGNPFQLSFGVGSAMKRNLSSGILRFSVILFTDRTRVIELIEVNQSNQISSKSIRGLLSIMFGNGSRN